MPSTHTSLHYHLIFSTKERFPSIDVDVRARIHAYLGGVVRGIGGVALEVGGVADHVHLVVGLKPTHSVADVMRTLKGDSSRWIHEELRKTKFGWQEGYGAFTVSRSNVEAVRSYVRDQEEHHRTRTFQEEYLEFLKKHEVNSIRSSCGDPALPPLRGGVDCRRLSGGIALRACHRLPSITPPA